MMITIDHKVILRGELSFHVHFHAVHICNGFGDIAVAIEEILDAPRPKLPFYDRIEVPELNSFLAQENPTREDLTEFFERITKHETNGSNL